ncbi:4Fe-4S dicluster domain-containing protein [Fundidesulfovibrio soli]|uniref:4Fe-4S dicluster domain-containing protein n=1 Tax=Fundidesulfovibrio soli TaxID=2922716 RepID=UPI001FAEF971|nr:4Fe-4S dicluster domain-containing protein [Fundidesulfovibrio soli]
MGMPPTSGVMGTLLDAVRGAGVVGEGGAGFPAHVKYDTRAGVVIANGCECEPLLYTDQHLMRTRAGEIARALREVMAAVGAERGVVAIKAKYADVARALEGPCSGAGLELALLDNFYPAGDEHILVHEVTGRTIPPLGLPKDVDALVANVGTLASVSQALDGLPVTRKALTVTGEVARPCVLEAPLGTSLAEILDFCGGPATGDPVFLLGGPMMGRFLEDRGALAEAVVTKTSGGLIVLPRGHFLHEAATLTPEVMRRRAATACIQCRYCTDLCPRYLVGHSFETHRVMKAFGAGLESAQGAEQALLCCECGVCELFSCPMRLSPRRINALFKAAFRERGVSYQGPREVRPAQAALRPYRKIPASRLASKTGLAPYMDIHPEFAGLFTPGEVRIPLRQHIGAPAVAVVAPGDRVAVGDLLGEIPEGALGARIHASIGGVVTETGTSVVVKGA